MGVWLLSHQCPPLTPGLAVGISGRAGPKCSGPCPAGLAGSTPTVLPSGFSAGTEWCPLPSLTPYPSTSCCHMEGSCPGCHSTPSMSVPCPRSEWGLGFRRKGCWCRPCCPAEPDALVLSRGPVPSGSCWLQLALGGPCSHSTRGLPKPSADSPAVLLGPEVPSGLCCLYTHLFLVPQAAGLPRPLLWLPHLLPLSLWSCSRLLYGLSLYL